MISSNCPVIEPEVLLEAFDEPLVIPRAYVPLTGGIAPALLLSALFTLTQDLEDQAQVPPGERGWLILSRIQWQTVTSLTRYEQEAARRALARRGFIDQKRVGMPARLAILLRPGAVVDALRQQARATYGAYVRARRPIEHVPG